MKRLAFVSSVMLLLGGLVFISFFDKKSLEFMGNIYSTGQWVLWFCVIVFLPIRLFNFYKQKTKTLSGYFFNIVVLILGVLSLYYLIVYKINKPLIPNSLNIALFILLIVISIKSIFDVIKMKRQKSLVFLCLLSIALLTILFLSII